MIGSTHIPSIGLTFAAAAVRVAELIATRDALAGDDDATEERRFDLEDEYRRLNDAILQAEPQTLEDVDAVLARLLCPNLGMRLGDLSGLELEALERVKALVSKLILQTMASAAEQAAPQKSADFAATRAMFAKAGPAMLNIPQHPTDVMARAAAAAAGITEEQARIAYTAAVAAFQGEAA